MTDSHKAIQTARIMRSKKEHAAAQVIESLVKERDELKHTLHGTARRTELLRINEGDYIDTRKFNRDECERFCQLAVECGHGRGEWMMYYDKDTYYTSLLGVKASTLYWLIITNAPIADYHLTNNISQQFRTFLAEVRDHE